MLPVQSGKKEKKDGGADGDSDDEDEGTDAPPLLGSLDIYSLHGGMNQKERTNVFHSFCAASRGVLLSTDVASRGLHLPKVG